MRPSYMPPTYSGTGLLVGFFLVLAALMFAHASDWNAEVEEERMYCQNVYAKVMPDYRHTYKRDCEFDQLKEKK